MSDTHSDDKATPLNTPTLDPVPSPSISSTPSIKDEMSSPSSKSLITMERDEYNRIIDSIHNSWQIQVKSLQDMLKEQHTNSITEQLWIWIRDCKQKRNAYWKMYYSYQKWNNLISVPLLLISSATGISSVVQLGDSVPGVQWTVAVLGVGSTALAAFQRYFRYGEKSEQCKAIAKRYALLARKGELQGNLFANNTITLQDLVVFMEDFRKDLDAIQQETDDMPKEILDRKHVIDPSSTVDQMREQTMHEDKVNRKDVMVQMPMPSLAREVMTSKRIGE